MATYRSMLELKIPTRKAASATGVSRTTANRKQAPPRDQVPVVLQNKLSTAERAGILAALNSPKFVDLAPMQVYTKLLDQGIYLGSLSTLPGAGGKQTGQGTPPIGQTSAQGGS